MEEKEGNSAYDYERCERVWRRVAPEENPYPAARACAQGEDAAQEAGAPGALVGAQSDPCCMGTPAMESIEVLRGFVREELAERQAYMDYARRAPTAEARRVLRQIACDEERHARKLRAVVYLITGEAYHPQICPEQTEGGDYCAILRRLYHEEACTGYNYFRAGEETLDYCLEQIFSELSRDEYRHARQILWLLEKALRPSNRWQGL